MNLTRYTSLVQGLNGTARKVFDAIPSNTAATMQQVLNNMRTSTGNNPDVASVRGCLEHFTSTGLVKEMSGLFQRLDAPKLQSQGRTEQEVPLAKPVAEPLPIPGISQRMRSLSSMFVNLAGDLEVMADEMDKLINEYDDKLAKLEQLKKLLGSL